MPIAMNVQLLARAEAAYLGLAIGDALGATVEFMTPAEIARQYGVHRHIVGGGWLKLKAGQVTDDTTMSWALGDAIRQAEGRVEALACAIAFDTWMRGKPVDIGNTVRRNLIQFRRSGMAEAPPSEHDAGNGAAMRVLPVALAYLGEDEAALRAACRTQAHVTHHNPVSDAACEFIALAVRDAVLGADLRQLYRGRIKPLLAAFPQFAYRKRRQENPSGYVVDTLQCVLQALMDTGSFKDCLTQVVNCGGDADTTGAIAGMLAGALYGPTALPEAWVQALLPEVRQRCVNQARQLVACGLLRTLSQATPPGQRAAA
ncbi:MAG: ADP-ribosyl-[dinitrogen reductase] hydrolase [Rhodocyclaceae bacterium]|nr:MAG: ADP-ribosyl-[dinitrogen reductase] hydrolase [Rhodocyclaceae bacterium]